MKRLFLLLALLMVGCGSAQAQVRHQWVEDNNLFLEDGLYFYSSNVTQASFNQIFSIAQQLYAPVAQRWGEQLVFRPEWSNSDVNAQAYRDGRGYAEVAVFGGLARRPEVSNASVSLVLCHELNHLYGQGPYVEPALRISCEGASDWGGAGWCLRNILERLPDNETLEVTQYMTRVCQGNSVCVRRLAGAHGLGKLLARLNNSRVPDFETRDPTVVSQTNLSYPSTQCRLDSYNDGVLNRTRPKCWFRQ